jgi:hypothetical protein
MTKKYFYERNDYLLEHETNITFGEALRMTEDEFVAWCRRMREAVVHSWDDLGLPPRVGWDEADIKKQFRKMEGFPVHKFLITDEYTGEKNVIRNNSVVGNAANQFYPTMMKTKITYGDDASQALSIYDHFKEDKYFDKVVLYGRRHFKRDGFYHYSTPIKDDESNTATEWIQKFESERKRGNRENQDYWIYQKDADGEYTGYNNKSDKETGTVFSDLHVEERSLRKAKFLLLTKDELQTFIDDETVRPESITNIVQPLEHDHYWIRKYDTRDKLFPLGFKAFRVSWCQYAVNFPPLTAKYLYERYTEHIKDQDQIRIWDPSAGWGGRILGAMSVESDRNIHYIGTDPNTDHHIEDLNISKYEYLADFYNDAKNDCSLFPKSHTREFHQIGSETFDQTDGDMVFTSPPYFAKEVYSADEGQSCHKFGGSYDDWRDGFLRPTLENAVKFLKSNRYLLWNIADAKFGKHMLPLEQDSIAILKSLGMEYVETLKMCLAQMPGANRLDAEGKGKAKNTCLVKSKDGEIILKYEPISVWRKP